MAKDSATVIYATYFQGHGCINFSDRSLSGGMSIEEVKRRANGAPCFDLEKTSIASLVRGNLSDSERCCLLKADPETREF